MKYYALSRIKHNGEVFEKGDTIELEKDHVLVSAGVVSTDKPDMPPKPEDTTNRDLVIDEKTREANRKKKGTKEKKTDTTSPTDKGDDGDAGYEAMSNDELKAELKKRNLGTSGAKAVLVARLVEDDGKVEDEKDGDIGDDL